MCETIKTFVVQCIKQAKGDDLHRAKSAFKNFTHQKMNEEYGQSGKTPQQIIDGYKAHEQKCNAAIEAVERLL